MTVITDTVDLAVAQERAFALLSDRADELKWNDDCLSFTPVDAGALRVGWKCRQKWRGGPTLTLECIALDGPNAVTYRNGGPLSITSTARFATTGDGTELTYEFEIEPRGIGHLFGRAFIRKMESQIPRNMKTIKAWVESESPDGP